MPRKLNAPKTPLMIAPKPVKPKVIPSIWKDQQLAKKKAEIAEQLKKDYGFTEDESTQLVDSDALMLELFKLEDKHIRLRLLKEIIPEILNASKIKAQQGWTQNTLHGITALGIALDKALEKDTKKSTLNIDGKNVQVNLDWKPKWLKGKG